MEWRLVNTDLAAPAYTVAADEAIALAVSRNIAPNTLHFYRRDVPTVSLGYFQEVEKAIDLSFCQENNISIMRRISGGSAVYTDPGHLIYGLAVGGAALPNGRNDAFKRVCGAIILALNDMSIDAEFKPVNDILVNGRKISGSAQMRRWDIVLQHGTIVLDNDSRMLSGALKMDLAKIRNRDQHPETYVTSIAEVTGQRPDISKIEDALVRGFSRVFDVKFQQSGLTDFEKDTIDRLINEKYENHDWNFRR